MCFTASKLILFFRGDKYSSANHAFSILEGLFFADAVVPEIGVPDPKGFLVPVVGQRFFFLSLFRQDSQYLAPLPIGQRGNTFPELLSPADLEKNAFLKHLHIVILKHKTRSM